MSKFAPSITCVLTFAMFVTSVFADTVTLKSGEHLEGKITKETDKDITIERVSGGVVDERVVPKAEIEKIDKVSPELQAFHAIEAIQVRQTSLTAGQYDPYIQALQAYVNQFPNSVRAIDVQTTLNAFIEEKKRVEKGDVKINGEWIGKAEADKEKVQINGRLAFTYMQSQSGAGDLVGALNTFAALEKTYPGAAVMPDAIEMARKIIPMIKNEVERAIPEQKVYKTELEKGFAAAGPTERAQMTTAFKKEQDAADAAATAADSANHWAPFIKTNEKCLKSLQTRISKEAPRLANLHPEKMRESLALTETARQSLANGDVEGANKTLKEATGLWSANELAIRLAKDSSTQLKAAGTAAPAPAPAAPAPAATPKPKAKPSTPRPSASAPVEVGAAGKTAQNDSGDDRPFYMTLPGAATIVVGVAAVLAGANIFMKMRKRKAEQAE